MRYILECPECDARFELKKYVPDHRTRCRKCRSVMVIPRAPGDASSSAEPERRELDPRIRQKLVRVYSLKKLAIIALLLCAVLGGAVGVLLNKRAEKPEPPAAVEKVETLTLEDARRLNRLLALPLRTGHTWEYSLVPAGTERIKVGSAAGGASGGPEFRVGIIGSRRAASQTLQVRGDGVYLLSEVRRGEPWRFDPPLLVVPHPIFTDSAWSYAGERVVVDGAAEPATLDFKVTLVEMLKTRGGEFVCFRVEIKGEMGSETIDETRWYSKGVGLIKRRTKLGDAEEEAALMLFTPGR